MTYDSIVDRIRAYLRETGHKNNLLDEKVQVSARPLSPEEVIGNPEHDDYPLVTGRERMMEAVLRGARGHAFTDMYGRWDGTLREVCEIAPVNNFRRAILVATLNAAMRLMDDASGTVHCKDSDPVECGRALPDFLTSEGLRPPVALIGCQPRLAEAAASLGELRIVDMDPKNIGQTRAGVEVLGPERTAEALAGAGCALVTGSTIVNGSIERFLDLDIPTVFYGVTIAGAARLLGLRRYCPKGA